MRSSAFAVAVTLVLTLPHVSNAQVYQWRTPSPYVTAANAEWRLTGEPIYYAGGLYYPTGPTEYFDGEVMARTGMYEGVPVYENRTLEPYSMVYVPIGRNLMRPYELKREGRLVGTVGSRPPSFPIQRDAELATMYRDEIGLADLDHYTARSTSRQAQWDWAQPEPEIEAPPLAPLSPRPQSVPSASLIRTLPPRDTTNAGAYLLFENTRFYSSGRAVVNDPQRFTRAGDIRGAAVFRELKGNVRTIFVEAVPGGALAPYTRR